MHFRVQSFIYASYSIDVLKNRVLGFTEDFVQITNRSRHGCFSPVVLLLADQVIQFPEALFFPTILCLEKKIHITIYLFRNAPGYEFFQNFVVSENDILHDGAKFADGILLRFFRHIFGGKIRIGKYGTGFGSLNLVSFS